MMALIITGTTTEMTTKAIQRTGLDLRHLTAGPHGGVVADAEDAADADQELAPMPELHRMRSAEDMLLAI